MAATSPLALPGRTHPSAPVPPALPDALMVEANRLVTRMWRRYRLWYESTAKPSRKGRVAARRLFRWLLARARPEHRPFIDAFPRTPGGAARMVAWVGHRNWSWLLGRHAFFDLIRVGAWASGHPTGPDGTLYVRDFPDREGQAYIGNIAGDTSWKYVCETPAGYLSGWLPTASAALRAVDEHLLREGYVLDGEVHGSPMTPGHRMKAQGFARGQ